MKFILKSYWNKLTTAKTIIDSMLHNSRNDLSQELRNKIYDWNLMFAQVKSKIVQDAHGILYNGDMENDEFTGERGYVAIGLLAVRDFGEKIQKEVNKELEAKKKLRLI